MSSPEKVYPLDISEFVPDRPPAADPWAATDRDALEWFDSLVRSASVKQHERSYVERIRARLCAHMAKPSTKEVDVWRVSYAKRHHVTGQWLPEEQSWPAEAHVHMLAAQLACEKGVACICITGPHKQTVPAD